MDRPAGEAERAWSTSSAASIAPIAVAKQRAKIPADSDVEVVVYPPRKSFYELLSDQFSGSGDSDGGAAPWLRANLTQRRDRSAAR